MRYAIFGDIHGNLEALDAVLNSLDKEKPDHYICVGDIVGYGANPCECIKRIQALKNCTIVAGNHDYAAVGILNTDFFNGYAREAILWTSQQLSADEIEFLRRLKLVNKVNNITTVHSTLNIPEVFGYIQTSYDLQMSFMKMETPICFIGHSHVPIIFSLSRDTISLLPEPTVQIDLSGKTLVNIGSVGQSRDGNPQACFGIYDEDKATLYMKRIDYTLEKTIDKIKRAGLPEILGERLRCGQ
jgi:predicted phosphodiesterase